MRKALEYARSNLVEAGGVVVLLLLFVFIHGAAASETKPVFVSAWDGEREGDGRSAEQPLFASASAALRLSTPRAPSGPRDNFLPWTSVAAVGPEYGSLEQTAPKPVMGPAVVPSAAVAEYEYVLQWGSAGADDGQFTYPGGIEVDSFGNVYVTDINFLHKFDSVGNFLMSWRRSGSSDRMLETPAGIAIDGLGNVYVVDTDQHCIVKFDVLGEFIAKWGVIGSGEGEFTSPSDIAIDSFGNIYVADSGNNRVQKFDSSGRFLTKWGSWGHDEGQFIGIPGIAVDSYGNVYVADDRNNRVQKFDSTGSFLTKWGGEWCYVHEEGDVSQISHVT